MQIFVNERSFCGQFHSRSDLQAAVVAFLKLVTTARTAVEKTGGRMLRSQALGLAVAFRGESLTQSLNYFGRDLADGFKSVVYDMANPAPWEDERVHQTEDLYFWPAEDEEHADVENCVTDTSVAEIAERRLQGLIANGVLLGIKGSAFDGAALVDVLKLTRGRVAIRSFYLDADLERWISHTFPRPPPYTADAKLPPRDDQTCLVDRSMFEPIDREFQGRRVYRHLTNGQFYYVDNLHEGAAAHLEVFDKRGRRHLGEASIADGRIRPGSRDLDKKPLEI